ncbi:MAG TPA: c-type cytochrome [Chthoniobacterales bacterium]
MKHITIALLTFLFAVVLAAPLLADEIWTAPARAGAKKNPVPADATSIARGKTVFVAECVTCHGTSGKGDGPQAKDLEKNPGNLTKLQGQSPGALFWKVTEGRKPMPSLGQKLTEQQRWDVVNYIQTLGK